MNPEYLQNLLEKLYDRKITPKKALEHLKTLPFEDLGFAQLDHHRRLRTGMPEVIYCEGKTPDQILKIIKKLHQGGSDILATRLAPDLHKKYLRLKNAFIPGSYPSYLTFLVFERQISVGKRHANNINIISYFIIHLFTIALEVISGKNKPESS